MIIKDGPPRSRGGFGSLPFKKTLLPDEAILDAALGERGDLDALQQLLVSNFTNPALDVVNFFEGSQLQFDPKNAEAYKIIETVLGAQGYHGVEAVVKAIKKLDSATKDLKNPRNQKLVRKFLKAADGLF